MSHARVIQDSDDEDDPLAADFPPPANPTHQANNDYALDSVAQDVPITAQVQEPNHPIAINFDVFLQSQESAPRGLSSSQQRREERWIPNEAGGGGSIGEHCAISTLHWQHKLSYPPYTYNIHRGRDNDDRDWSRAATALR